MAEANRERIFRYCRSVQWRESLIRGPRLRSGCGRSCQSGARGVARMAGTHAPCSRPLFVRHCTPNSEAFAAFRRPRNDGQWQANPRKPRYRHSIGGTALLSSRRMGAVTRAGISRVRRVRRCRTDHPLEFSPAHACLENRTGARYWEHGCTEACRVYAAHGAAVCGDLSGSRVACGRSKHRNWRRLYRRSPRQASGSGQDCLHRIDRGRARNSRGHSYKSQALVA